MEQQSTKAHRVLNLIKHVDLAQAPLKKWAVIRLLEWQPLALRIRFEGKCHCHSKLLMSYQLPEDELMERSSGEPCGYYCPSCKFSGAGTREGRGVK